MMPYINSANTVGFAYKANIGVSGKLKSPNIHRRSVKKTPNP